MAAAATSTALRRLKLAAVAVVVLSGCESPPAAAPAERAAPRHPIQPYAAPSRPEPASATGDEPRRLTPGPNSRVTPTPDLAPRVEREAPADAPSSRRDLEDLGRRLQEQREWKPETPGPPIGTIDRRPGTIRTNPGTIEIPH